MQIALDAMGGDHAPEPIVAGAAQAVAADPDLRVLLVGDRPQIEASLARAGPSSERLEIFHCTQVITMEEAPVVALARNQSQNRSHRHNHRTKRRPAKQKSNLRSVCATLGKTTPLPHTGPLMMEAR